jgi:nucleoredoxin
MPAQPRIASPWRLGKLPLTMHLNRRLFTALTAALLTAVAVRAELATWKNIDGASMEAEFLGRKGDYVTFRKADGAKYLYPYAKLSAADQARVDALLAPPADTPDPAAPGKLVAALSGRLVHVKGSSLARSPDERLQGVRYLAVYYSAHWCPPCRAFTPDLVAAYRSLKAEHPEFELVFVSSDRNEKEMRGYMTEYDMPWLAVAFDRVDSTRALARPGHENGIPNLVFLDADGKELSTSFSPGGDYLGPHKVLADIRKHFR